MITFKIRAERLPQKWHTELRQALAGAVAVGPPGEKTAAGESSNLEVTAEGPQIVDRIVAWIRETNRRFKSQNTLPGPGISLRIEKPDGAHILLTERNGVVVKRFLAE